MLVKVDLPEMKKGQWSIEKFKVDHLDFGILMHGRIHPPIGESYTRLKHNGWMVMSDTPAEMRDHYEAVLKAQGSCLLNGLGIGMVLKNILLKPEVTDVTVVEISQDLIDMVMPFYPDPRITCICHDAYTFKPPKGKRYGMVWHDVWNDICADNLEDMSKLHRKYGRICDWQGSWCKYQCQRARRSDW